MHPFVHPKDHLGQCIDDDDGDDDCEGLYQPTLSVALISTLTAADHHVFPRSLERYHSSITSPDDRFFTTCSLCMWNPYML